MIISVPNITTICYGIQPDILLCRCDQTIPESERRKLALFCNVRPEAVIEARDAASIYAVPMAYHAEGLDARVVEHFDLPLGPGPNLARWRAIEDAVTRPDGEVEIAIVGKYTALKDAYKSLNEALSHGGLANRVRVRSTWVEAADLEDRDPAVALGGVNGVLVPGGFGKRGSDGKIAAARFARERQLPFFGICFGMQMAVLDTARHLAGLADAGSSEFGPVDTPLVGLMTEWTRGGETVARREDGDKGGTMRLGAYPAVLAPGSRAAEIYGAGVIHERHRHRYEVNVAYRAALEAAGLMVSGVSPDGLLPEIVERPDHPWFIGVQFHPELKSRPFAPHPLFVSFIAAAIRQSRLV